MFFARTAFIVQSRRTRVHSKTDPPFQVVLLRLLDAHQSVYGRCSVSLKCTTVTEQLKSPILGKFHFTNVF